MNYLGHAYLSFGDQDALAGNLMSDFIKGKSQYVYPISIQKGIKLHREIDIYTDNHADVKLIAQYFKPYYRLYAYPITDIVLDYFLANDKKAFPDPGYLKDFSDSVYTSLRMNEKYFPEKFSRMFPYMETQDWLYNYQYEWGIEKSLHGLMHRASYISEMDTAFKIFQSNQDVFQKHYDQCFPSVKNFALNTFNALLKD